MNQKNREDIILASGSPRRIEMFHDRGYEVRVHPADIDETLPFDMTPEAAVMYLSLAKALHVAEEEKGLIIAADTVVVYDGEIIGKPADSEEAFRILSRLREQTHQVITGVCIIDNQGHQELESAGSSGESKPAGTPEWSKLAGDSKKSETAGPDRSEPSGKTDQGDNTSPPPRKLCLYDVTDVVFGTYSDEELQAYVETPEPYDKAGGYAIQETFGKYIDHIEGDLDNVIGFPMYRVEPYLLKTK